MKDDKNGIEAVPVSTTMIRTINSPPKPPPNTIVTAIAKQIVAARRCALTAAIATAPLPPPKTKTILSVDLEKARREKWH
jgi:hypothetical protein